MNDEITARLRETIRQAFPPEKYNGTITPRDPGPWSEELDEEQALYETLKGHSWTEISPEFLRQYPDAYLLLTPEACGAFIAAWLNYSVENMDGENQARDFLIYTCSPPGDSWKVISPLNPQQRKAVRALIAEFVEHEHSRFKREKAPKRLSRVWTNYSEQDSTFLTPGSLVFDRSRGLGSGSH